MSETSRRRIALVPTRYGDEVIGGSEAVMREIGHGLVSRGWDVDVLTTCARSHYTWDNDYPAGVTKDGPVRLLRFPTVSDGDRYRRDILEGRIQLGLRISPDEQQTWLHGNVRVPELFHHLLGAHRDYDAIVLSPYLFWTAATCWMIAPEKTVVMPCLHDEPYAYLEVFRPLLTETAQVWFLSEPEHHLAHRLTPSLTSHVVTGAGVADVTVHSGPSFAERHGLGGRPFVLYAGRREGGKGWYELLGAFAKAVLEHGADLDLVTTGVGPVEPPAAIAGRVHDIGFQPAESMPHVFAAAAAYVQPSRNESFSRVIMESWLAGTPVIANGASEVVAWHCRRSGGGVIYEDPEELVQALVLLADDPAAFSSLAKSGEEYVRAEYSMAGVLDRMEAALGELIT